MILKSILPVIALSLFTIGCADSSGGNNTPQPAVPEKLGFTKPTPGQKLTENEIREMESIFADKPMMILPPEQLLFPDKETTYQELAYLEQDLMQEDPNSYRFYKDIQQNCQISNPEPKIDFNFPLTDEGQVDPDQLKAGNSASVVANKGITGSSSCPGFYGIDLSMGLRLDQINIVKEDAKKSSAQMNDCKFKS